MDRLKQEIVLMNSDIQSISDRIESIKKESYLSDLTVQRIKTFKDLEDITICYHCLISMLGCIDIHCKMNSTFFIHLMS